jgi:benzodiazapine receptor
MTTLPAMRRSTMDDDLARRILTVASYLVTLAVNGAANALPINGQQTGEISDRYEVYVVPAGYVFGVWGVIYLGLGAFTVYQAVRGDHPVVRRLGWLPAITGLLNIAWILCFHYGWFALSVVIMMALLATLIAIYRRIHKVADLDRSALWAIAIPFSIYLGWITVAAVANVAQTLDALGFEPVLLPGPWLASIVLAAVAVIGGRFVIRNDDAAYGAVIVWAFTGVAVKEASTPVVSVVAAVGAMAVAAISITRLVGRSLAESRAASR